jgi:hypothetical protein
VTFIEHTTSLVLVGNTADHVLLIATQLVTEWLHTRLLVAVGGTGDHVPLAVQVVIGAHVDVVVAVAGSAYIPDGHAVLNRRAPQARSLELVGARAWY